MAEERIKYLVNEDGKKESILLPIKEYHELMDDLADLVKIAERKEEPSARLDCVKKRLEGKWQSTESK